LTFLAEFEEYFLTEGQDMPAGGRESEGNSNDPILLMLEEDASYIQTEAENNS